MAKILKATEENLDLCKQQLDNSRVIAVPTETVYGLAGNALDKIALNTIFEIKIFIGLKKFTNKDINARKVNPPKKRLNSLNFLFL